MAIRATMTMKLLLSLSLGFFLAGMPCASQETAAEPSQNKKPETSSRERIEYQKKIEARLHKLGEQEDVLKKKAIQQSKEAKKQLDAHLDELDRKRAVAEQEFEKLKYSSEKAWRDLKPGLDAAMKDLEAACKRAASEFN
jgi:trehalose/maltose hydrolase-like predicted phosphorylase